MTQYKVPGTKALRDYFNLMGAAVLVAVSLSACSQSMPKLSMEDTGQSHDSISSSSFDNQRALQRALDYWSKEYSKNPGNATYAYNYANNLIIAGKFDLAFRILGDAIKHNPDDEKLISEYGRLSLKMNKVSLAEKILNRTKNMQVTDWRILSARGTIHARNGNHPEARKDFEQALKLSPNEPSVINNLALSYALTGESQKAEGLLQRLAKAPDADSRITNNLALVLGLQGKFDQAEKIAKATTPVQLVKSNMDYLRRMVTKPVHTEPLPAAKGTGNRKSEREESSS